jgi:hypothetical protein
MFSARRRVVAIAAAALLLTCLAGSAIAQGPPQGGGPEQFIAQLRAAIRPGPQQQAQFEAVAQVMREQAAAEQRMGPPPQGGSAVDLLRAQIQIGDIELGNMKRMLPALEGLYAVLSPQQRAAADAVFQRQQQGPPR